MRHALRIPTVLVCAALLGGCSTLTNLWDRIVGSPAEVPAEPVARTIPAVVAAAPVASPRAAATGTEGASAAPLRSGMPEVRMPDPWSAATSTALPRPPVADAVGGTATPSSAAPTEATPSAPADDRTVYFDFDSSVIRDEARAVIEAHARTLAANPGMKITVEGHADERGGREYNLSLGQKRAEAVLQALVLLGANEAQLEAVSFGEERPVVVGAGEEAWSKNRRAELKTRR